jgi:ribosomal protein L37AE/L43A
MGWTFCPDCGEPMQVERTDNGVMMVWHGTHCGWGQAYMADEDVYPTREALIAAKPPAPPEPTE